MNVLSQYHWTDVGSRFDDLVHEEQIPARTILERLELVSPGELDERVLYAGSDPSLGSLLAESYLAVSTAPEEWTPTELGIDEPPSILRMEAHRLLDKSWLVLPRDETPIVNVSFYHGSHPDVVSFILDPDRRFLGVFRWRTRQCRELWRSTSVCEGGFDDCDCQPRIETDADANRKIVDCRCR